MIKTIDCPKYELPLKRSVYLIVTVDFGLLPYDGIASSEID